MKRRICRLITDKTPGPTASRGGARTSATVSIAERLGARRISSGRWIARCPAHADRAPSLTIAEGRDGRALLYCFAGCNLGAILRSVGLSMHHLFPDCPRPSAGQLAAAHRESERRRAQEAEQRRRKRTRSEQLRWQWQDLKDFAERLARPLATMPDDTPGGEALTACFHMVMDELRSVDRAITGEEQWP